FLVDSTHSRVNNFETTYGMSDPFNTCTCPTEFNNKIVYSNKQDPESQIDAWRNFQVNNSFVIRTEHGQLQKMFVMGDNMFAHTTDMLINLRTGHRNVDISEDTILLGSGSLFNSD